MSKTLRAIIALENERRRIRDLSSTRYLSIDERIRLAAIEEALARRWEVRRGELGMKKPQG